MIFILLSPPHPQSSLSVVSVREETLLRAIGHLHFEVAKGSFTKAAGHHGSFDYQGAQTHHIPSWQPSRLLLPHTSFFLSFIQVFFPFFTFKNAEQEKRLIQ